MKLNFVEKCINRVNKDFVVGTWNFNHERNLQCLLFGYLRRNSESRKEIKKEPVELVHAEFNSPADSKTRRYLDLAIMENGYATLFRERYGCSEGKRNRGLSLKVAIEIKSINNLGQKEMRKISDDLRKLKALLRPLKVSNRCYFLLYVDAEANGDTFEEYNWKKTFQTFQRASKLNTELKVCCVLGKQHRQCWFSNGTPAWEKV